MKITDFVIKIVGGTLKGSEIPVRKSDFTIGRSSESDVQINDTLMSRVHCRMFLEDNRWFLEDLNSTNGTWMLGQKVDKRVYLPLRTSVRVGKAIFEIVDIYEEDHKIVKSDTIAYRIQPETLAVSPLDVKTKTTAGIVRDENKRLSAIYKFQNIISTVLDEKELYCKILSAIFNVIPTDEAYLLLYDLESGDFVPEAGRNDDGFIKYVNPKLINKGIVSFVKENQEAVLSIEPGNDSKEKSTNATTSLMCVPLLGKEQINGMLYLVLNSETEKYTEDDLRLLTVIGHTSGMAIEHSKMMEFNLKNERLVATGTTAAGLSHYIKNILAGLDGSLNLLRMGIDEVDLGLADEAWNILNKNHRRLGNLVLDLLNLASEQKPNFEIQDINDIIRDVSELLQNQLAQEGIRVELQLTESPLYTEIDPKGIHRVLLNLVTNSEQAVLAKQKTMEDKDIGYILLSANFNETKDYVIVTVSDNGVGVDKEEMVKMFDLFVTSKGTAGTGLGLAVCKRIIEAHSGSVTASGEKGKGCTIAFSLPVTHNEMNTSTISMKRIY